jgi:hypothetical protein
LNPIVRHFINIITVQIKKIMQVATHATNKMISVQTEEKSHTEIMVFGNGKAGIKKQTT